MKTIEVTKQFKDKENDEQLREVGETFEVSNKRGDDIIDAGVGKDVTKKEDDKKTNASKK